MPCLCQPSHLTHSRYFKIQFSDHPVCRICRTELSKICHGKLCYKLPGGQSDSTLVYNECNLKSYNVEIMNYDYEYHSLAKGEGTEY